MDDWGEPVAGASRVKKKGGKGSRSLKDCPGVGPNFGGRDMA